MAKKVNINELARRYTTAVFDLAKSEGSLDKVAKDLDTIETLAKTDDYFKRFLNSPVLAEAAQIAMMQEFSKSQKLNKLTLNFLLIVVKNGRLQYLTQIIKSFRERIAAELGEIKAEITTAQKLTDKQLAAIAKDLSNKTGGKIKITETVKPEIIGGLIVKIGAKMFDYSVKSRLTKLKNKLKESA